MVSSICELDLLCIDLSEDMLRLPKSQLDEGYDGSHYGQDANEQIAELIKERLELEDLY